MDKQDRNATTRGTFAVIKRGQQDVLPGATLCPAARESRAGACGPHRPAGEIVAYAGPNGAGKSTSFSTPWRGS